MRDGRILITSQRSACNVHSLKNLMRDKRQEKWEGWTERKMNLDYSFLKIWFLCTLLHRLENRNIVEVLPLTSMVASHKSIQLSSLGMSSSIMFRCKLKQIPFSNIIIFLNRCLNRLYEFLTNFLYSRYVVAIIVTQVIQLSMQVSRGIYVGC